jgi:hypothetical protein
MTVCTNAIALREFTSDCFFAGPIRDQPVDRVGLLIGVSVVCGKHNWFLVPTMQATLFLPFKDFVFGCLTSLALSFPLGLAGRWVVLLSVPSLSRLCSLFFLVGVRHSLFSGGKKLLANRHGFAPRTPGLEPGMLLITPAE